MDIALSLATLLGVVVTILPLWRLEQWWVRDWDFPRLQLCAYFLVLIILHLSFLPLNQWLAWILLCAAVLCLLYHLAWIVVYTPFFPVEVKKAGPVGDDRLLALLSANVLTPNRKADALLALVRQYQPDVLLTLESDAWWQEQLDVLDDEYPFSKKCPLDNLYGMHLYSKLKLSDVQVRYLVEADKPSIHCLIHLRCGTTVDAHFVHPAPPSPTENDGSGERDAELLVLARSIAQRREPIVVAGDLNDVAWSETTRAFRKISGLLDPRKGRGMFNTFHAQHWFLRWPLDHLFHSHHFTLKHMRRLGGFGSDHFALYTELAYEPERAQQQAKPKPDAEDLALAEEKQKDENIRPSDIPNPGG